MAVSKRTRFEVLRRDNYTCRYCRSVENNLTVDHVTPVALGGGDDPNNLVASCKDCNAGKSSSSPDATLVSNVSDDAVRWAAAIATAAFIREEATIDRDEYVDQLDDQWNEWGVGPEHTPVPRPIDWRVTVWRFHAIGLTRMDMSDSATIALSNRKVRPDATWTYMCGVAWSKVTEMQDMARAIIAAQSTGGV